LQYRPERCNISRRGFLGNNVKIQNNVSVYTGVICEDDVFLGPSAVFTNVVNPRSHVDRKNEFRKTLVMKGATIGANATVVCGHNIGRYALVGGWRRRYEKNVPDFALVVGNPARVAGWVCKCGVKLEFPDSASSGTGSARDVEASCAACGDSYIYNKETGIVKEKA
jgi:UDP-2-acetamido-3-amino-2,3-dideoxy-glucuronate N-acetyltransferase